MLISRAPAALFIAIPFCQRLSHPIAQVGIVAVAGALLDAAIPGGVVFDRRQIS